ncbi:extracellular solute-binding protein [Arenibaculum sp.]|uniref:extracellular solute-binding protein n=1 Tax=Arenibaculum sp. TaxID=2865862 RepID=UPI002E0E6A18|nr:extracellular solute-binding protein [Arenibaculum sp.]
MDVLVRNAAGRVGRRKRLLAAAAGGALAALVAVPQAGAQTTVRFVGERYPALEFYAEKLRTAMPDVNVTVDLMPNAQLKELQTITLSSGADTIDIFLGNDLTIANFAANGWLEPLDPYIEKYREEFDLDDFASTAMASASYEGKVYGLPVLTNTQLFAYRQDLFEEKGIEPPTTFEEYEAAAAAFHSPAVAGTVMTLKGDGVLNEAHYYLNAIGDGWFDADKRPVFNSENGVRAIETMKAMTAYAPRGYTANGNDESTILFQQGAAAMGMQWLTRTAAMDREDQSRVVGKMMWAPPPGGGQVVVADSFAISKFSSRDKDLLFRLLATTLSADNQREGAKLAVPTRVSVLQDPELQQRFRYYGVLVPSLEAGANFPKFPEFKEVSEVVTRRIMQAVTGEMPVKEALDTAAAEAEEFLTRRGVYK